ncbi:restriction endonuclease subunit S [Lactococcus laudensis]|uniref:restriction endonuclease subunit S n=1 Tax=Pseudolactococcus laudensis TaxID=1494461 RepID=UPI0039F1E195
MAKIDDSVKKKVPELRFKGFTDEWEQRKLGDEVRIVMGQSPNSENYTDDPNDYILVQGNADMKNGRVLPRVWTTQVTKQAEKDDLILSVRAPVGDIGKTAYDVVIGRGVAAIKGNEFIFQNLGKMKSDGYWTRYSTGSTFESINSTDIKEAIISVPAIEEQDKIGSFFKQLDKTIALHQRKLDLLKEQKKGYLQKMFPKNCEKVPELRFEGFADDWEERKLSSMTNYKNGKSHEDKQSTSGKLELINLNSISISGGLKHSGKFIDEADDTLQKDDLVMILSDVGHGDLLGRVALIPEDDRFVLNQRVALLRPNTTADPQFLFSYINAHQYYFKAQGAGMSQLNISKGSVENFISFVPIIEEQKKIGAFYKRLDDTIALHQRKLDLLKEQKKGFLQKMFV